MKNYSAKKLVSGALMIALIFLATYFTRIPTPLPGGYFNLGDALIMLAAAFLGPIGGMAAGAIGSALADIAAAAMIFAPITFIVKGVEGLVVGLLLLNSRSLTGGIEESGKTRDHGPANIRLAIAVFTGAIIMVIGYFAAEAFLLVLFDEAFGWSAAIAELLPNSIQGALSAVLAYILIILMSKVDIERFLE